MTGTQDWNGAQAVSVMAAVFSGPPSVARTFEFPIVAIGEEGLSLLVTEKREKETLEQVEHRSNL